MPSRVRLLFVTPDPSLHGVTAARERARAPEAAPAHLPSYALARTVWFARCVRAGARRYGAATP